MVTLARADHDRAEESASAWFSGRRSPATRRAYRSDLCALGRFLAGGDVAEPVALRRAIAAAPGDLPRWRDEMMEARLRPATIARRISAARAFFRYMRTAGLRLDDPAAGVEVPRVSPEEQHAPSMEASDVRSLLRVCQAGRFEPRARRNRTIVRLGASLGLRSGEIAGLRVDDVLDGGKSIRVRGKGGRVRTLDTSPAIAEDLVDLAAASSGASLFGVGTRRLRQLVARWCELAEMPSAGCHALRRTYATVYLDRGGSIETLRRSLGHSDPRTTARYDRRRQASAIVEYD